MDMKSLTIGRLAKQAGVNLETVRFYERRGLLPKPPRTASGYRLFPADAACRLRFIRPRSGAWVLAHRDRRAVVASHITTYNQRGYSGRGRKPRLRHRSEDQKPGVHEEDSAETHKSLRRMRTRRRMSHSGKPRSGGRMSNRWRQSILAVRASASRSFPNWLVRRAGQPMPGC